MCIGSNLTCNCSSTESHSQSQNCLNCERTSYTFVLRIEGFPPHILSPPRTTLYVHISQNQQINKAKMVIRDGNHSLICNLNQILARLGKIRRLKFILKENKEDHYIQLPLAAEYHFVVNNCAAFVFKISFPKRWITTIIWRICNKQQKARESCFAVFSAEHFLLIVSLLSWASVHQPIIIMEIEFSASWLVDVWALILRIYRAKHLMSNCSLNPIHPKDFNHLSVSLSSISWSLFLFCFSF